MEYICYYGTLSLVLIPMTTFVAAQ